ncbi:MAG: HD domain-containing phosphohydrolase [Acidobacteriota bacterium]
MNKLSTWTKAYIILVIAAGIFLSCLNYLNFPPDFNQELLFFLALTAAAGVFKVSLPYFGTLSIAYIFVFVTLLVFGITESILASIISSLTACLFNVKKKNPPYRILFNIFATALTSAGAANIFILMGGTPGIISVPGDLRSVLFYTFSFYVINTFLISAAISLSSSESILTIWKENYLWTAINYFIVGSSVAMLLAHLLLRFNIYIFLLSLPIIYISYYSLKIYLAKVEKDKMHNKELANLYLSIIEALAFAIDAKDRTTEKHLRRVQNLALGIAKEMGMEKNELEALKAASLLHDIGKIAVPEYILSKPGKLTPDEFKIMSTHPAIGANILETVKFPYPLGPTVRYHHERYDGSGYPEGLKAAAIPLAARILAVVDCYDALTTDRPYRKALSKQEVTEYMNREAGKSFDPDVVRIMLDNLEKFDISYGDLNEAPRESNGQQSILDEKVLNGNAEDHDSNSPAEAPSWLSSQQSYKGVFDIYETIQTLEQSLDTEELFLIIASKLQRLIHFKSCILFALDHQEKVLVPQYVTGQCKEHFRDLRIAMGEKLSGWALMHNLAYIGKSHRNPLNRDGTRSDLEELWSIPDVASLRNSLAVPLLYDGEKIGVLALYDDEGNEYLVEHLNILRPLSTYIASALKNSLLHSHDQKNSCTDLLTGLPNADYLFMFCESESIKARATGKEIVLLRVELSNFEKIKIEHGTHAGKRILIAAARSLKKRVRSCDLCARFGLNEFIIIIPSIESKDVINIIGRIRSSLLELSSDPSKTRKDGITLKIRMGCAIYPQDGEAIEALLSIAELRKEYILKEDTLEEPEDLGHRYMENILPFRKKS